MRRAVNGFISKGKGQCCSIQHGMRFTLSSCGGSGEGKPGLEPGVVEEKC